MYLRAGYFSSGWRIHWRKLGLGVPLLLLAGLAGCQHDPPPVNPPVDVPESFSDVEVPPAEGLARADRWWTAFGSPSLNEYVQASLDGNLDLAIARHRLRAARALARREGADLAPELDGVLDAEQEVTDDTDSHRVALGVAASSEVDLWGRIDATVDAARLRAEATAADYQAAAISLSANVTLSWLERAGAAARRDLLRSQVQTNERILKRLESRLARGISRSVDVLRQKQLLAATREALARVEARVDRLDHQLAVLRGRPPRDQSLTTPDALPPLPPWPEAGLPMELVRRRPDLQAAFLRLQASNREVAAAISDRMPRLNLTASWLMLDTPQLNMPEDWALSLAASLVAPIIDGGRREAEVDRTQALERAELAGYGQAILTALREVEDALWTEARQRRQVAQVRAQVEAAERAYRQLEVEYLNGVSDFLDMLTALSDWQQLQRDLVVARREQLATRVALYRALAGGFEWSESESSDE
ncbi:MAG: efflux transporter outer membrane subunit [Phycisphaeraceae bacterium]|nr:efflux transporter outer membrane subunit [Phycisphaeraceae bacterium]